MKKIFSFIVLISIILSTLAVLSSCAKKTPAPEAQKIILSSASEGRSVEITDSKIIQKINDRINSFEYRRGSKKGKITAYTVEWLDENGKSLKTISVCENGEGIIYNNRYYHPTEEKQLDMGYFDRVFDDLDGRTLYRIPQRLFKGLFYSLTTKEFFAQDLFLYDTCEDFRNKSYADDENNIVLLLTEAQKAAWLAKYNADLDNFEGLDGVEIANDYSKMTITKPKPQLKEFLDTYYDPNMPFDMVIRQIVSGKDIGNIAAEIVLIDEITGDIVYSVKWPDQEIKFEW